jgi:signal transduction histidine kinase
MNSLAGFKYRRTIDTLFCNVKRFMEVVSTDILQTSTIIQYPSIRISKRINSIKDQTQVAMVDNVLIEAERIRLLKKISNGIPLEILKKKSGVFATSLVHEVRNPLTNINLAADILSLGSSDEEQEKFINIIKRGVERINDILTTFLTAQNEDEIHAESCSVVDLMEEVLAINKDRLALKKVVVRKNFSPDNLNILVKKPEVKIALINIVVNAIEALPPADGILTLSSSLKNDQCILEIEDNGIGISEKNLANIFDPYYTNKPGGMGLGLSTTMDILLSNCGTMDVQSEEGSGTHFTLHFNQMGN